MKNLTISIAVGALFTISSCTKDKKFTACINSSEQTVEVYETITFVSCTENAETLLWDFKNGTTSDKATVVHQYDNVGTYEVSLTVTKGTEVSKTTKTIVVKPLTFDKNKFLGTFVCDQTCTSSPLKSYNILIESSSTGTDKVLVSNINKDNTIKVLGTISLNSSNQKYKIDIASQVVAGKTVQGTIEFLNDAITQINLTYSLDGENCSALGVRQ